MLGVYIDVCIVGSLLVSHMLLIEISLIQLPNDDVLSVHDQDQATPTIEVIVARSMVALNARMRLDEVLQLFK